jgi:hypothetical protein
MTKAEEEIAALRARIEELERAAKPEPAPDPKDFERYDPTANMTMPASVLREMVRAVPDFRDVALRDARAPTGPSAQGVIPSSQQMSNVRVGGSGVGGWAREIPLGPQPGINHVDALIDQADAQDRAELVAKAARFQRE